MGLAAGLWSLLLARLVIGWAQAGLFPGCVISISQWLPASRRALACGCLASSMSIGGAVAAALTGLLLWAGIHWRWVFPLASLPGILWAVWFYGWFRDRPEQFTRSRWLHERSKLPVVVFRTAEDPNTGDKRWWQFWRKRGRPRGRDASI